MQMDEIQVTLDGRRGNNVLQRLAQSFEENIVMKGPGL